MSRAPSRATGRRLVAALALVALTVVSFGTIRPIESAGAAGEHRAGIVVDTGSGVHTAVITFSEDSISGIEALERMPGANPVVYGFAGVGGAVCALFGVGQPGDSTCLKASDGRYWAYFRAAAGAGSWTYSRAGAGTVQVHDGDVEGWRFGTGEPPAAPVIDVPDTPPATAAPTGGGGGPAAGATGGGGGGGGAEPGAPQRDPSTAAPTPGSTLSPEAWAAIAALKAAGATTTSTTSTTRPRAGDTKGKAAETEVAAKRASATRGSDDGSGGSVLSFAAFAAVLVILAAAVFLARRARIGRSAGPS